MKLQTTDLPVFSLSQTVPCCFRRPVPLKSPCPSGRSVTRVMTRVTRLSNNYLDNTKVKNVFLQGAVHIDKMFKPWPC